MKSIFVQHRERRHTFTFPRKLRHSSMWQSYCTIMWVPPSYVFGVLKTIRRCPFFFFLNPSLNIKASYLTFLLLSSSEFQDHLTKSLQTHTHAHTCTYNLCTYRKRKLLRENEELKRLLEDYLSSHVSSSFSFD